MKKIFFVILIIFSTNIFAQGGGVQLNVTYSKISDYSANLVGFGGGYISGLESNGLNLGIFCKGYLGSEEVTRTSYTDSGIPLEFEYKENTSILKFGGESRSSSNEVYVGEKQGIWEKLHLTRDFFGTKI